MLLYLTTRLMVASALLTIIVGCAQQSAEKASGPSDSAARSASTPAMRVYVDPKTGELRDPTPEELAAEAADARKKQATAIDPNAELPQSKEVVTPSGAIEVPLDRSHDRPLQGCIDRDGELKMEHQCAAPPEKEK